MLGLLGVTIGMFVLEWGRWMDDACAFVYWSGAMHTCTYE